MKSPVGPVVVQHDQRAVAATNAVHHFLDVFGLVEAGSDHRTTLRPIHPVGLGRTGGKQTESDEEHINANRRG